MILISICVDWNIGKKVLISSIYRLKFLHYLNWMLQEKHLKLFTKSNSKIL